MPRVVSQFSILHSRHPDHGSRSRPAPGEAMPPVSPFAQLLDGASDAVTPGKDQPPRTQASPAAPATAAGQSRADKSVPDSSAPQAPQTPATDQQPASATAPSTGSSEDAAAEQAAKAAAAAVATLADDQAGNHDDKAANASAQGASGAPVADASVTVAAADPNAAQPAPEPPPAAPPAVIPLAPPPAIPATPTATDKNAIQPAPINDAAPAAPNLKADDVAAPVSQPGHPNAPATTGLTGPNGAAGSGETAGSSDLPGVTNATNADASPPADAPQTPQAAPKPAPSQRPAHHPHAGENPAQGSDQTADEPLAQAPTAPEPAKDTKSGHANAGVAGRSEESTPKHSAPATPHIELHTSEATPAAKPAIDAVQLVSMPRATEPLGNGTAPALIAAHTPAAADTTPVAIAGLAVEIAARAQAGRNRFEIRLDPPELGRIDVRLDVDGNGNVTSRLLVERAETLEVLRRDAGELQRALQDAGLKTSDNGLQFALRDQGFAGRHDRNALPGSAQVIVPDVSVAAIETVQDYGRVYRSGGGIDIRV